MQESAALRSLASLLRSGATLERALVDWPERVGEGALREWCEAVAARVNLGVEPADAVTADGAFAHALGNIFAVHAQLGGDIAGSIDELAARTDSWSDSSTGAAAQAAGAKLSGRMISFLPLVFLAFTPGPKLPLQDPVAMTTMLAGVCLVAAGALWMGKLIPIAAQPDLAATVAGSLAAVLRGGASPSQVLTLMAERDKAGPLDSALRRVSLGLTWEEALTSSADQGLSELGRTLATARSSGAPVAPTLKAFATERERESILRFEAEARRAPVRMVLPLTLCMLPAFLLLGAGPLVRGLSA